VHAVGERQTAQGILGEDGRDRPYSLWLTISTASSSDENSSPGDRTEDLLLERRMIRSAFRQHRRPVEQALVGAACGQPRTGLDAPGDKRVDAITLARIDDRAERGIRRRPSPTGRPLAVADSRSTYSHRCLVHEMATGSHANLTLVQERPQAPADTAAGTSTSSSTSMALLPPSSR